MDDNEQIQGGYIDSWMSGQIDDGWVDGWLYTLINGWSRLNNSRSGWKNRQMDRQLDGQIDW